MTDQQAPERIWIKPTEKEPRPAKEKHLAKWKRGEWKDHDGTAQGQIEYVRADLLGAAEKRRDELAAEVERLTKYSISEVAVSNPNVMDYMKHWEGRALKAEAERDQALASVGAVIEKAAAMVATPDEDDDALDRQTRRIASEQLRHDFNPDATAALNEMLAEAWVEGMWVGLGEDSPPINDNPYRKATT